MADKTAGDDTAFNSLLSAESTAAPRDTGTPLQSTSGRSTPSKIQQPKPQVLANRSGPSAILVSSRQKGNPILNHIKLLPWEYADIPADYVLGATTCALFLSLKYHRLHPEYIYSRIKALAGKYMLRILLIIVDIPNHEDSLKELSKTSIINNLTLMLCWSATEAAHYLELFKASENAQPTAIRTQQAQSYKESLVEFVTTPRSINKSDAASLISTFGSLQNAINAQPEQISAVPGWGEKKVHQWCNAVREDFRVENAKRVKAPERSPVDAGENTTGSGKMYETTEAAMYLAEAEGRSQLETQKGPLADDTPQQAGYAEEVSDGIAAALAKLRESGG
ncbi:DNA repair protein RAD10 [Aspergillus clavatus NRRL 1]|uniref:Mating-type switch/DNA repair protein Swi10/Rad10, putative n=1 Tax=Aspergillus clavatus (strain ATCC 1007 / CBS 513.65 / DSM 816 / NCTC 3887 / NRRL 1 / QM 1276 / 107) TaxID=344612 RepID=A1CGT8_ASPCL|nr:mating-type switch/DNA repair protein Swi10/Rad10, putative [Aspergillus clavatus NRRL 1]EAW10093.1 mating-type switch/DNA repair protein Swi10/Rad10, putative [Aspergillus clavatus NRRL 1]